MKIYKRYTKCNPGELPNYLMGFQPALANVLAASLPEILPSIAIYTATITGSFPGSHCRSVIAFWSSAQSHAVIASFIFPNASSSSFPCDTHPGIAGHSATIQPSSAFSRITWNIMLTPLVVDESVCLIYYIIENCSKLPFLSKKPLMQNCTSEAF